jgi:hypothetical protein
MTLYLQLDGVDDYLTSKSNLTINKVKIDFAYQPNANSSVYLIDGRGASPTGNYFVFITTSSNTLSKGSLISTMLVDGVSVTSKVLTPGQKYSVEATFSTEVLDANGINFFVNFANQTVSRMTGNIYRVTGYRGGVTSFDYDMSTGNVNDISGNGNNATLTGGTWLDDGTGGSSFTDGSTTFDTKQTIYNDSFISSDTKQVIYSDSSVQFDTQQVIQTGGIDGSVSFDTKQTLYSDSSVSFDTKQGLYSDSQVVFNTKQSYYNDGSVSFDTLQVIEKIDWVDGSVSFDTQQLITETPKVVAQEVNLTFIAENEVNLSSEMENSVSLSFTI